MQEIEAEATSAANEMVSQNNIRCPRHADFTDRCSFRRGWCRHEFFPYNPNVWVREDEEDDNTAEITSENESESSDNDIDDEVLEDIIAQCEEARRQFLLRQEFNRKYLPDLFDNNVDP